ncbi:MAG TPA: hypothetical protein PLG14_01050 [Spirochaetales bacterium]|nr:hypothetical protein [Spirochaetales bacterium]
MKKKVLLLALVVALVAGANAFAYRAAVGGEFAMKIGQGLPNSALLSFRLPSFPAVFGLGLTVGESTSSLALLADWWLYQGTLVDSVGLYVGPGAFLGVSADAFTLGLRVPVGINIYPIKPLELFVEFAPAVTFIAPSGVQIPAWGVQAGFGFRFWF